MTNPNTAKAALTDTATMPSGAVLPGLVDLHVDLSYQYNFRDKSFEQATGQFVESKLVDAGVRGVVLPLFVPATVSKDGPTLAALERSYERVQERLAQSSVYLLPGVAAQPGRVQTWLAFEGSAPVAADLDSIATWVRRGVRVFGLVHSTNNPLASSATDKHRYQGGLTELGRKFVERVHREGGLIDVSHASEQSALAVSALGRRDGVPVLATHSNVFALNRHPRNLSDDAMLAIANTGGLIGVNFHSPFLREKGRAEVADVVKHIKYVINRVGVEHVALGSDFEGGIVPARGLEDVSRLGALADAMRRAGLSADQVHAVFGGNALRVLTARAFSRAPDNARRGASEEAP